MKIAFCFCCTYFVSVPSSFSFYVAEEAKPSIKIVFNLQYTRVVSVDIVRAFNKYVMECFHVRNALVEI